MTFAGGSFKVGDRGHRTRSNSRREGGRKDESRSVGADHVNKGCRACHVAANDSKSLAEGAGDNVDAVHDGARLACRGSRIGGPIKVLCDTGSAGAIHPDGMDLIQEGNGAVFFSQIADGLNVTNVA